MGLWLKASNYYGQVVTLYLFGKKLWKINNDAIQYLSHLKNRFKLFYQFA